MIEQKLIRLNVQCSISIIRQLSSTTLDLLVSGPDALLLAGICCPIDLQRYSQQNSQGHEDSTVMGYLLPM